MLFVSFIAFVSLERVEKLGTFSLLFNILREFKVFVDLEDNFFQSIIVSISRRSLNFELANYDLSTSRSRINKVDTTLVFSRKYLEIDETFENLDILEIFLLFSSIDKYCRQLYVELEFSSIN